MRQSAPYEVKGDEEKEAVKLIFNDKKVKKPIAMV